MLIGRQVGKITILVTFGRRLKARFSFGRLVILVGWLVTCIRTKVPILGYAICRLNWGFFNIFGRGSRQPGWLDLTGWRLAWWHQVVPAGGEKGGKEDDVRMICLFCSTTHLFSFGFVVSWTGVESGPGELLPLLFTLWLLVIWRSSRARKEATLDSISDCECLGQDCQLKISACSPSPLAFQHLLKFKAFYGHLPLPLWNSQARDLGEP